MKQSETFTWAMWPEDHHEKIPTRFIEVEVRAPQWLKREELFPDFGIEIVPVEQKYSHEVFIICIDKTEKLGVLAEALFRITTGKNELPKPEEYESLADAIIGRRLMAKVIILEELGTIGDRPLYDYKLVVLAPLNEWCRLNMDDMFEFSELNVYETTKEEEWN